MHAPLQKKPLPSPSRPQRARRERRSDAVRKPVLHLVMPGLEVARTDPKPRETITAFLRRTGWAFRDKAYGWQFRKGLPTVLEINGEPILRRQWRSTRIAANDNVRFVSFPLGGSGGSSTGKQVIGLVALIAVSAFAIWAGPLVAGALGFTSAFAGGLATAGITLGGALLVNALVAPKSGATNAPDSTQDQIYSIAAQGNTAKLGQPLPVWYGQLLNYPDFAATPWGEFVANDQYLNVLLSMGMGSFSFSALYVDQTVLWDPINGVNSTFSGVDASGNIGAEVAFYEAGAPVTLFAVNVDQSIEVTGQQFPDGTGDSNFSGAVPGPVLGPFISNPSATLATQIVVDFVFPGGCFTQHNGDAAYYQQNFRLIAQYAPVNDAGTVIGAFTTLFDQTRTYCSNSPIRDSISVAVAPGRYTVQVQRGDQSNVFGTSACLWAGLRSFLQGSNTFPDVATVAIKILATLSTQGSFKFGVLATRKLPVWNGSAFVTQATRNPAWAFLDAVTNTQYGSQLLIDKVDFNSVVNLASSADARGDSFDYKFSTAVAVPAAFDMILMPTRARHYWLGDTVSVVRDEWRDVPSMLLTDREIVRDSVQVNWTMLGDEDPDAVIVEYIDNGTWLPAQVQYPPNSDSFTSVYADVRRVDGITDRNQAFRECAFYYLQSIYRRENVQVGTEYEGRAITQGAVLRLQSELPMAYGYSGAVITSSGDALTLDPAPTWDTGPFYVRLRQPNGIYFGPVLVTEGSGPTIANLDPTSLAAAQTAQSTTLAAVLTRENGGDYPSFEFGTANSESKLCVVLNGVPNGELCTLAMVVDDIRVHATDLGTPPVLPTPNYPFNPKVPLIVGLNAFFGQGVAEPQLSGSWFPAAGAVYYIADISFDSGQSWQQVYEGVANSFQSVVTLAALQLRVQAVNGTVRGPYSTLDIAAPSIVIGPGTVALDSLIAGIKYQVTTLEDLLNDKIDQATQLINSLVSNQDSRNWLDKKSLRSQITAQFGVATADITEVESVAVDAQNAVAALDTTVTAQFGTLTASVDINTAAIATLDGYAAASYAVTLTADGYATGFELVNGGSGVSSFTVTADKFQVAFPGHVGGAPTPVFTIGNVGGVPKTGLRGDMLIDGTLTTAMLQAGAVTAITIGASAVTASKIAAGSITSDSGVIGALSVKSLSIGDNAVTIPFVATATSAVNGDGVAHTVMSPSFTVDTTGLAGKIISIFLTFVGNLGYNLGGYGTGNVLASSNVNGGGYTSWGGSGNASEDFALQCTGVFQYTASGGIDTINTIISWIGGQAAISPIPVLMGTRILYAQVAKR